jgi:hypothetical protein
LGYIPPPGGSALIWEEEEGLGLAVREGWEVERGLAERGRGDYYERIEGYCLTDEQGNMYVASIKMGLPSNRGREEVLVRGR